MNNKNLINLKTIDPDKAKAIRSLGGKARQEQRKRQQSITNYFKDYLKVDNYINYLESIVNQKLELNNYQKEIIRKEFMLYLITKGYIRIAELTEEERLVILEHEALNNITQKDLINYFKYRYDSKPKKKRKKKTTSKRKATDKAKL